MHINKLTALIPAQFEYKYSDAAGVEHSEIINLQLRRMSFATAERELQAVLSDTRDIEAVAKIIVNIVADWDIYTDESEQEKLPISVEWFTGPECPYDFAQGVAGCVVERLQGNPPSPPTSQDGSEPAGKLIAATS